MRGKERSMRQINRKRRVVRKEIIMSISFSSNLTLKNRKRRRFEGTNRLIANASFLTSFFRYSIILIIIIIIIIILVTHNDHFVF